jgi:hypothetical protein
MPRCSVPGEIEHFVSEIFCVQSFN